MTTSTTSATTTAPHPLRTPLVLDGIATGGTGLLLLALGAVLDGPLGIPAAALLTVGAFFLLYGAGVLVLGTRPAPGRRGTIAVVVINLLYVLDSVLLVAVDLVDLTALGVVAVLGVAAVVAALAAYQVSALRS